MTFSPLIFRINLYVCAIKSDVPSNKQTQKSIRIANKLAKTSGSNKQKFVVIQIQRGKKRDDLFGA
jgi:hypothetical protein